MKTKINKNMLKISNRNLFRLILMFSIFLGSFLFFGSGKASAATYYTDDTNGSDSNLGTDSDHPWQTIDKVNNSSFDPGDNILFKRGETWREQLTVPSSGIEGNPITFGAYGEGDNPAIKRTTLYDDIQWSLYYDSEGKKIWMADYPPEGISPRGLLENGERRTNLYIDDSADPETIIEDMTSGPWKGKFYYRKDSGSPSNTEVGARQYGILIQDKSNVIVDGIDCEDPGASSSSLSQGAPIYIAGTSDNVTIKNLKLSKSSTVGISDSASNSNIVYDGITSHDNQSTGIYMTAPYGGIKNSKSYDNCQVSTDEGDCGGIGIQTGDIYINNNEIYHNGRDGRLNDMELSIFLDGKHDGPLDIRYNYIHDCWDGCGQIYAGGGGTTYAYNVIDGFADTSNLIDPGTRTPGSMSGIRLGNGGDAGDGTGPIYIYNNIFMNGGFDNNNHNYPSAVVIASNGYDGTKIKNNIFFNNGTDISVLNRGTVDTIIDNNIYYKTSKSYTKNWIWKTVTYDTFASYKEAMSGLSPAQDVNSLSADPLFASSSDFHLQSTSPAINAGVDVGLTEDYEGNSIVGLPDIGAYEYHEEDSSDNNNDSSSKPKPRRSIVVSPKNVTVGQTLKETGRRFSKNSQAALYFSKVDGSYYPPKIVTTDKQGRFTITYAIKPGKPRGKYSWHAVDLKTGKVSKYRHYWVR
jgi:hypothetical protein